MRRMLASPGSGEKAEYRMYAVYRRPSKAVNAKASPPLQRFHSPRPDKQTGSAAFTVTPSLKR